MLTIRIHMQQITSTVLNILLRNLVRQWKCNTKSQCVLNAHQNSFVTKRKDPYSFWKNTITVNWDWIIYIFDWSIIYWHRNQFRNHSFCQYDIVGLLPYLYAKLNNCDYECTIQCIHSLLKKKQDFVFIRYYKNIIKRHHLSAHCRCNGLVALYSYKAFCKVLQITLPILKFRLLCCT